MDTVNISVFEVITVGRRLYAAINIISLSLEYLPPAYVVTITFINDFLEDYGVDNIGLEY